MAWPCRLTVGLRQAEVLQGHSGVADLHNHVINALLYALVQSIGTSVFADMYEPAGAGLVPELML